MNFKTGSLILILLANASLSFAQPWTSFGDDTRYMAIGDSISAGYGALPVTQGFVYRLYQSGDVDNMGNLLFCPAAVPGATSNDVLQYQVPQMKLFFKDTGTEYRKVVTLTVGGNDLFSVVKADGSVDLAAVPATLQSYAQNLGAILTKVITAAPDAKIYVGNLYDPKLPIPGADQLIGAMNQAIAQVVGAFNGKVVLVDLFAAFQGRSGLLLSERNGAAADETHPTNAGYAVIASSFSAAMKK